MSLKAMIWAVEVDCPTPLSKLILILLAEAHNGHTDECFPRIKYLMDKSGLGETAVKDHIKNLERVGLLRRELIPHSNGRTKGVQYHLNIGGVVTATPSGGVAVTTGEGSPSRPTGVVVTTPSKDTRKVTGKENLSSLRSERARRTRLPEGFQPTGIDIAYGLKQGLTEEEVTHETEKFRNYWLADGGCKANWHRALHVWLCKAVERRPRQAAFGRDGSPVATGYRATQRALARVQALGGRDGRDEVGLPF